MKPSHPPRRLKAGAHAAIITAAVLAAVILLNVAVAVASYRMPWQVDETTNKYAGTEDFKNVSLYTPTAPFLQLIEESAIPMVDEINAERAERDEAPIPVNIIFCDDRDRVDASTASRYILYTALHLQDQFPDHIRVSFVNVEKNPSAVQQYKITSSSQIYSTNVIITFGSEFRVYGQSLFFESEDSEPWAYDGEKAFARAILAVTRAEAPVAAFITNHGERVEDCTAFRELMDSAGYIVRDIDLEKNDIPEDCRLLICYDPQRDFHAFGNLGETGVSEIQKLDDYLDGAHSFMLFIDNETPVLPNLEEYMEEWGVSVARGENADGTVENYHINDPVNRLDAEGYHLLGDYATVGSGASITKDMRSVAYPAKVVFPNATAIKMSSSYEERYETDDDTGVTAHYGHYLRNSVTRTFSDVFTAGAEAVAEVGGETYEITTVNHPFRLMTVTGEERRVQETNLNSVDNRSFVCVFASTEVVSDDALTSPAYGNANAILATLNTLTREVVPANLMLKAFAEEDIDEDILTATDVITPTVCLALIPAAACFIAGAVVQIKRKHK